MLRSVLVVDDEARDKPGLADGFRNEGIVVHCCVSQEEAMEFLNGGTPFDAVVLDWHLIPHDDQPSLLVLSKLRKSRFVPVVVWTGAGNPELTIRETIERQKIFPQDLIHYQDKSNVTPAQLGSIVQSFYTSSLTGQLAQKWREASDRAMTQALYDLATVSSSNLLAAIKGLADDETDVGYPIAALQQLVHRNLADDDTWRSFMSELLTGSSPKLSEDQSDYGKLVNLQRYFSRKPAKHVRTGDLIKVEPLNWQGTAFYGLVATPACDLAQKNTRFVRVLRVRKEMDVYGDRPDEGARGGRKQDRQWLPYLHLDNNSPLGHYFANFHEVVVLLRADEGDCWMKAESPLSYEEAYILAGQSGLDCQIKYICSMDEPYQASFLTRFSSHSGRIGTQDVDRKVK